MATSKLTSTTSEASPEPISTRVPDVAASPPTAAVEAAANTASTPAKSSLLVSVVSAVYNAETWLETYLREVHASLATRFKDFEIVIVDNGSSDHTVAVVEHLQDELSNIQLYCLIRHLNQESAFVVGLEQAIGDVVITLDANYDPPAELHTRTSK